MSLLRYLSGALLSLCAAAFSFAQTAPAAPPEPVPLERFFQRPAVLEAKLSPSGQRVAITTSRGGNGRIGLVVLELQPAPRALRIAQFSDADVMRFDWVSDERQVFSVVDLESGSGEDRYHAPGLYSVSADGQDYRMLVKRRGTPLVTVGDTRRDALDWNHWLLAVPLQQEGVRPDEVVIGQLGISGKEISSVTPLWLNTRSGRTRPLATGGAPANVLRWLFDSKGQPRLAQTRVEGRSALYWRGPGDEQWRELASSDLLRTPFTPRFVDDDGTLYVSHREGPGGYTVLSRFDFEKTAPQTPPLVRTPGFDFNGSLILDRAGSRALGVRADTDGEQTVWFDAALQRLQAEADARLPGRVNRISCRRCGAPDMVALVRSYADRDPGRLWLYEAAGARWSPISAVLDQIDPARMAAVELQRIKARDGRDLPVWLTRPSGVPAGQPAPAVVLVHGGPWVRGGHWRWQPMEQFLASRGYLVISPDFRGSTGYGQAHYRAGWKQWGRAMQDDVADALLWAQAQGLASSKACIAGGSYGGYATLMGLVRDPQLYRCGVAWVAVTDPFLFLKGSWWIDDDIADSGRQYLLPELVGDAEKDAAMLTEVSPLAQAARIKAPLLLAIGEADRRVPPAHGQRLREALQAAGHPPEWVSYPDEGHSWRLVATQVDFARRFEAFLARHLKEAP